MTGHIPIGLHDQLGIAEPVSAQATEPGDGDLLRECRAEKRLVPYPRAHVVDALYLAMSTLDPNYVASLRGVSITHEERDAAEQLLIERIPPATS